MLAQLATLCGILPEYQDHWGQSRVCSDATRRSLLGAMGLATGTDAELRASLERMASREVRRMLPPSLVAGEDPTGLDLPAWLPESAAAQRLAWRLTLENGETRDGAFPPPAAPGPEVRWIEGVRYQPHTLRLPSAPGLGYHTLEVQGPAGPVSMRLIVTPERCFQPPALEQGERLWGFGVQLYAVRSRRNWGMGDFTDLRTLLHITREAGGDLVGVNPLHALFPEDPEQASPYSPSSRCAFNVLYLDVEALPDFKEDEEAQHKVRSPEFQALLRALRSAETVDYGAVAAIKFPVLESLYQHFREGHQLPGSARGQAFEAYRRLEGRDLHGLALFQALQEHLHREDPAVHGWQDWPEACRNPEAPQVRVFEAEHGERISFWEYLQWQAELQVGALGARSLELGLGVGLYADLAVGVHSGGAETWLHQDRYALGAGVGAPPDDFCLDGQDWGLPPMIPHRLADDFEAFSGMLRANMRHAGALRIDHVMGLMRLFWVPGRGKPAEGAYVAYPFRELMGILALESQRNHCLVIGEDLGTVPQEVRAAMGQRGILSCHPLFFERDWESGAFRPPAAYPSEALASVGTHDLPTLAGYWQGHDLELRNALGLIPSAELRDSQVVERAQTRAQLLVALGAQGLPESLQHPLTQPAMTAEMVRAVLVFLARSPARLLEIQPEDVLGQIDQVNLPGSLASQHPNWRRKLTLDLEEWAGDARFQALGKALMEARGPAREAQAPPSAPGRTARIPESTYRLQFSRAFTLADATALVPYLHALGVSHCYASPLLRARLGSPHGYDIIDHHTLNPEIGTPEELAGFVGALHQHGMGLILDFVPNHMAVLGSDNAWWQDVMENGQASAFAPFFDIDWRPLKEELRGKVLLPVLGAPYGSALEGGELTLDFDGPRGEYRLNYGLHCLPVDPGEYPRIFAQGLDRLGARMGKTAPELLELESIIAAFRHLPARDQAAPAAVAERARDKEISKQRLATLWGRSEDIRLFIEENLRAFRGTAGDPQSFDLLHQLIQAQAFRLAYWRVASDDINYRRFFDINDLAGIRMELEPVFEATHALLLEWVRQGYIDGLRLDHPDGLYDPLAYFQRLQQRAAETRGEGAGSRPLYLVAEKILARHERIPEDWPIHGETGYRFANEANGIFVDSSAQRRMDSIYAEFTGRKCSFEDLLHQSKALIIRTALASELNVLANHLSRIALANRQTCDFTLNNLRDALSEVVARFPVYRTYLTPGHSSDQDRRFLQWAVATARKSLPEAGADVFDFIREVLSGEIAQGHASAYADQVHAFAMKFQQYTAPVMAKGMEDTCFYRYNRLISLNDVGGDPQTFGISLAAFHEANRRRASDWPHGMLASSTHDSKHSEDFRLRVDVISEMPAAWKLTLRKWARMNRARKTAGPDGGAEPSRNDEYLLYQTLLGAWPLEPMDPEALGRFRERVQRHLLKVVREAKAHTSWNHPDPGYEAALAGFVAAILSDGRFLTELQAAVASVARPGLLSGLSLALLKIAGPGVPDIYQGLELPVFSLVDPDNRRAVDFALRRRILDGLRVPGADPSADPGADLEQARSLLAGLEDGRAKCFVTWRALNCRREHPDLFRDGDYVPLHADGPRADHICAFARRRKEELAVVVAPRLFKKLQECGGEAGAVWQGNRLEVPAPGDYCNALTGECHAAEEDQGRFWLPLAAVLGHFPVALLMIRRLKPH
jgi:(1->4)-alpha-D-glucan 1-alpha-D-glucosylmutase